MSPWPGRQVYITNITYTGVDQLLQADLDGSNVNVLVDTTIAHSVETLGDYVYWTENTNRRIRRALLDGSYVETVYQAPFDYPSMRPVGLAIDSVEQRIYWANQETDDIRSIKVDGTGFQILSIPGIVYPYALAIDEEGRHLFWTQASNKRIYRSNLDGSNPQLIVQDFGNFTSLFGLTIDPVDKKIYWTNSDQDVIRRANYDGTQTETIVHGPLGSAYRGIEVDELARKLYWVDDRKDTSELSYLMRSNLDGSGLEQLATFTGQTVDVAVSIPEPTAVVLSAVCFATMVAGCKRRPRLR